MTWNPISFTQRNLEFKLTFEDPLAISQVREDESIDVATVSVLNGTLFKIKDYFIFDNWLKEESYVLQKKMPKQMKDDFASEVLASS